MKRRITILENGDILVDSGGQGDMFDTAEKIVCGVVLLTPNEAFEAEKAGWREFGTTENELDLGLIRMMRR